MNMSMHLELQRGSRPKRAVADVVRRKIAALIDQKAIKEGEELDSVYALSNKWNMNYRTLRSAFDKLHEEGFISYGRKRSIIVRANRSEAAKTQIGFCFVRWHADALEIELLKGIEKFAAQVGVSVAIQDVMRDEQLFLDSIRHPHQETHGLLFLPIDTPAYKEAISEALAAGIKVMFMDCYMDVPGVSSVCADHFTSAFIATRHLLEAHHARPVYYLGRSRTPTSCAQWLMGWKEAMRQFHHFDTAGYVFDLAEVEQECADRGIKDDLAVLEAARRFFDTTKKSVYSIFAGNNYVARGIYVAAEERGLEIGKDVFVVGTGDAPRPEYFPVPLSSIWQNSEKVGYEAAKILYEQIIGKLKRPLHRIVPVELRIRESSVRKVH